MKGKTETRNKKRQHQKTRKERKGGKGRKRDGKNEQTERK